MNFFPASIRDSSCREILAQCARLSQHKKKRGKAPQDENAPVAAGDDESVKLFQRVREEGEGGDG
jgi:hypothetical protein